MNLIRWFFGDRAYYIGSGWLAWFMGSSIKNNPDVALTTAEAALADIQTSIEQYIQAVATQQANVTKLQGKYVNKQREADAATKQVKSALAINDHALSEQAAKRLLTIRQSLANYADGLQQAEALLDQSKTALAHEQTKLADYQDQIELMRERNEVHAALKAVNEATSKLATGSAVNTFDQAKTIVLDSTNKQIAVAQLSQDPNHATNEQLNVLVQNDDIQKLLQEFKDA